MNAIAKTIAAVWTACIRAAPVRLWALILSGPPLTAFAVWATWIIAYRPWPIGLAALRLQSITWIALSCLFLILIMQVSLAAVRVSARTIGGTGFEVGGEGEDPPVAQVTTTTKTTVTPPAKDA